MRRPARGAVDPTHEGHAIRGRYPAALWDTGRDMVLMSWPAHGWVGESMEALARALGGRA
jgi:hypothetical protein